VDRRGARRAGDEKIKRLSIKVRNLIASLKPFMEKGRERLHDCFHNPTFGKKSEERTMREDLAIPLVRATWINGRGTKKKRFVCSWKTKKGPPKKTRQRFVNHRLLSRGKGESNLTLAEGKTTGCKFLHLALKKKTSGGGQNHIVTIVAATKLLLPHPRRVVKRRVSKSRIEVGGWAPIFEWCMNKVRKHALSGEKGNWAHSMGPGASAPLDIGENAFTPDPLHSSQE